LQGVVSTEPEAGHFISVDGELGGRGEIQHPGKGQLPPGLGMDLVENFFVTAAQLSLQLLVADADLRFEGEGTAGFVFKATGREEPVRFKITLHRRIIAKPGCFQTGAMCNPDGKKQHAYDG
jgi:hypothetical protein